MKASFLAGPALTALVLFTAQSAADDKSDREQALAEVKKLKGTIVNFPFSVSFDGKGVTDDDLAVLQKLPDLEGLYLRRCKITDKGLEKIAGLTKMKLLYLGQTPVTDKGLESLKGMTKLQSLSLVGTQVTDVGLAQLKGLTELRVLETKNTMVTPAGVAELKKSLPNLTVR
jgi:Leucine-rich repeat (LRR) protein